MSITFGCRTFLSAGMAYLCVTATVVLAAPVDPYGKVNESWERFGSVYTRIVQDYYSAVPPDSIMTGAIRGMLEGLDPYSRYYDAAGLRQLREDTTGKFAGLGITVTRVDGYPVVVAPIKGTPAAQAGLVTGDQIVGIGGRTTKNMPLDDVVDILRGKPDTQVAITVLHPGRPASTRQIVLRRQLIDIPTVTLVAQIAPGVGYIGMRRTRFSESTAGEVSNGIDYLRQRGVQALVLDLRGNPGGLLTQATGVADLFLPRGAPIVSIRERDGRREESRRSQQRPRAGDLPLAVLIDGGSASASEIVAGAIQDDDRGIIVGTTSFGKGSVQTIFDLHQPGNSALKLTTARYYTPSGRCIHREVTGKPHPGELLVHVGDQQLPLRAVLETVADATGPGQARERLLTRFRLDQAALHRLLRSSLGDLLQTATLSAVPADTAQGGMQKAVYTTRAGRRVFGGGGITPDVTVEPSPVAAYVLNLQRLGVLFQFAVYAVAEDSAEVVKLHGKKLDSYLMDAFGQYLARRTDLPNFADALHSDVAALRSAAEALGVLPRMDSGLSQLEEQLNALAHDGFPPVLQEQLLRYLKPQVALRLGGRRAQLRAQLEGDVQLQRAVDLLLDRDAYTQTLSSDHL